MKNKAFDPLLFNGTDTSYQIQHDNATLQHKIATLFLCSPIRFLLNLKLSITSDTLTFT